jgi:hypothetical protein
MQELGQVLKGLAAASAREQEQRKNANREQPRLSHGEEFSAGDYSQLLVRLSKGRRNRTPQYMSRG